MQTEMATTAVRPPLSRVSWSLTLLVAISVCGLSFPAGAQALARTCAGTGCRTFADLEAATDVLVAAVWLGTAAFVLLTGPATRLVAWIGATFVAQALVVTVGPALFGAGRELEGRALDAAALCLAVIVIGVFPDGRFVPQWSRWAVAAFVVEQGLAVLHPPAAGSVLDVAGGLVYFAVLATVIGGQVYRYRHGSDAVQRRQTKWFVYGLASYLALTLLVSLPYFAPGWFPDLVAAGSSYDRFQTIVSVLAACLIPVCVAIAVVREGLFDIDVVIGRTVVYAVLSLIVALVYLGVVAGVGTLVGGRGSTVLPLFAAAVVAVLYQPLRAALQRRARRLLYGLRDEPYEALSELGRRLAGTLPGEDVEARVVTSVRTALRVPYVAIALREEDGYTVTQQDGVPTGNRLTLPLLHQGEEVGLLLVDQEPGGRLAAPARALLADLAGQAGAAVNGVRLTASLRSAAEQLEAARARLVVAAEEERGRIRRNLHDDLAPTLAAAGLTASAAADLLDRDPAAAGEALDRLQSGLKAAMGDIRRLVDELRPVLLDERGLLGAVRERADALSPRLAVTVEAPAELPELPTAVEVSAYRICQEALMNVLRHSGATRCLVRLGVQAGLLVLEVEDDGVGPPAAGASAGGVGLGSMRNRAEELGGTCTVRSARLGGTQVAVRLPLEGAR